MTARTITFGDVAENGPGMEHIGSSVSRGLSLQELQMAQHLFTEDGYETELVNLVTRADCETLWDPDEIPPETAQVLIVRNGVGGLYGQGEGANLLDAEQQGLTPDSKAWMRGRVVNKHARHNLCFADQGQEADYENRKGTIVPFIDLPHLTKVRNALPAYFGESCGDLNAELNVYYDVTKCGIGFHGDAERFITIGMRFGTPIPFHYQWYQQSKPVGQRVVLNLEHGDLYAMGAKAVGRDWLQKLVPTLRHAAGCPKFTKGGGTPPPTGGCAPLRRC